ncbi:MAG: double-strand break repair protein AddB, partial [Brevundimonas sp.]
MAGWFTIPAHRPFLADLARGVLAGLDPAAPERLADGVILLPNRRAARALSDAFAEIGADRPLLLPQIRPLGDIEEDEPPFAPGDIGLDLAPAIAPLARRFELAKLVMAHHAPAYGRPRLALEMAEALGRFLDSCQIEEVKDPSRVADLVDADLAEHWQATAAFLAIAVDEWPKRLAELQLMDPQARKVALLSRLAEQWDERPPDGPVLAAGSTGTVPAAGRVLAAVGQAPEGAVVLPGLDLGLDDRAWGAVDDQHPQGAMKSLLDRSGVTRDRVSVWGGAAPDTARVRLISQALKPPEVTDDWRETIDRMGRAGLDEGLAGLTAVSARTEDSAAATAAVLMRQTLETPGATAALVTPDPVFARRVQARLSRWGLMADSSAGTVLTELPVGVLIGQAAALMGRGFSAVALLALIKHPLVELGLEPGDLSGRRRDLERWGLRGPRLNGWAGLEARLVEARDGTPGERDDQRRRAEPERVAAVFELLTRVRKALAPLERAPAQATPDVLARALVDTLERLTPADNLWRGPDGEAAAGLLAQMIEQGAALGEIDADCFRDLLEKLAGAVVVRTGGDVHPRLRILGAIEARLVRADRMILAGLEEGVWPGGSGVDPFLSRPMRTKLELPPPERRIGLSAHDFAQAASGPEVILLHAERRGGQPSVKSRWLWRLETLAKGAGLDGLPGREGLEGWTAALDAPDPAPPISLRPAPRPAPTPPVEARPLQLSVTGVETWVRDPYAIYARRILGLSALNRPDEQVDAMLRGQAIHKALELFADGWDACAIDTAPARFADLYRTELLKAGLPETALAREETLGAAIGVWATD